MLLKDKISSKSALYKLKAYCFVHKFLHIKSKYFTRIFQGQFRLKAEVKKVKRVVRRRLERYPLQVRHKQDWDQDWGRGFILLLPQVAVLPGSDAGISVIKPASCSSSKTVRPRAPCGARCIGQVVRTWSAVCLEAPHLQFGKGARLHLCMDEPCWCNKRPCWCHNKPCWCNKRRSML